MKSSICLALFLGLASSSVIESRAGTNSHSFAGTNNYFLHALHPEEQATYIKTLQSYGTKVVRLWVTGGHDGCEKSSNTHSVPNFEDTIGSYNYGTLDALDSVLSQLHSAGIKAIISPHDANNLPPTGKTSGYNGLDIYGSTYKTSDGFYSSNTAKQQYDARLARILNYKSPAFGKAWKDLSEVILAFDIQNEPMIASVGKLQNNDPDDWICGRAGNMKKVLGSSAVKVATGGIGGSQYCCDHEYNLIDKALYCDAIDIISVHGYMTQANSWSYFIPSLSEKAAYLNKHLMIEEWGVGSNDTYDSVAKQAAVFTDNGVPWLYWQIIPGKSADESCNGATVPACCHQGMSLEESEDYEVGVTSGRADFHSLIGKANSVVAYQDWTGFVY